MKKILIITGQFIFPLNSGERIRTWNFINEMSKKHAVSLLHLYDESLKKEDINTAKNIFENIWSIEQKKMQAQEKIRIIQRLKNFFNAIPWEMAGLNKDFKNKLSEILDENEFDFIFVRYIYQARYVFALKNKLKSKIIVDLDDIETKKSKRFYGVKGYKNIYDKFRKSLNIFLFEQYHKKNLKSVQMSVVCSEEDKNYIIKKKWTNNVAVIPNAINFDRYHIKSINLDSKNIFFCGVFNYSPNVDGALWFVKKIYPIIQKLLPDVKLILAGKNPARKILDLNDSKNIYIYSNVPDILPYYEQSNVFICPIRVAGGTRIKIIEAGACKRPVVSTTIGAEGLGVIDRKHCLIADDEEKFAQACVKILNNPDIAQSLIQKNHDFLKQNYHITNISKKINEMIE